MKMVCGILIGVVALLMVAHLALAGPPSWDDQINMPSRFKVLKEFNDAAVLDKETGLVWEQSPDTGERTWVNALAHCYTREVGGRRGDRGDLIIGGRRLGWRLPTIEELASLIDPTIATPGPTLPLGHPFSNVQSSLYWSATSNASSTSNAWGVYLSGSGVTNDGKTVALHVWCVRGGQGIDGVQ
jgi:hypothetical protein